MANIEWKQVQGIPGNPVDGFRTFMEGMRGAEAAARGIRQNQIQNTEMSLKIMDSIAKDQQAAQASMDRQAATAVKAAGKSEPFNRQELGIAAKNHFFSGGTIDDFQFAGFNPTDDKQYGFASNIFKDGEANLKQAIESASEQLGKEKLAAFEKLKMDLPEGTTEYQDAFDLLTQEYAVREGSIASTEFERLQKDYQKYLERSGINLGPTVSHNSLYLGSAASNIESKATGVTPKQVSQGVTGNPSSAQSRIAERDAEVNNQAGIRDSSITAIEKALSAGELTEEDAAVMIDIANKQYDAVMQEYDNEWSRSVMTGADGSVYGTDYQYNEDGTITVSGQTLSPDVSSAVQEAAEISGIPVDMQLAMYRAESGYNPKAVSKTGAGGLGQLTEGAIKDVIRDYPEELEAAGIPLSVDMDRSDPRTNAIVSALYMKLQYGKYMGEEGSIEERYITYNIGANNPFVNDEKFIRADPDTPVNQIGFPISSDAVQKNIEVYKKPNGQWRTKNEIYSEIRRRMGITKASPEDVDSARSIEDRITDENATTPSELSLAKQKETPADVKISKNYQELANINPTVNPEAFANAAGWIADSIPQNPGIMGGDNTANLDKTFYEEALGKAGVPADNKTVARIHKAFSEDPELRRLNSDAVSMLISWAPKGMWGSNLNMAGLRSNIKQMRENQKNNHSEYLQFVDDSKALKKVSEEIKTSVLGFKESTASSQKRLDGYTYSLGRTNDPKTMDRLVRARNSVYNEMDRAKTLHKQGLQRLTAEALERAAKIETKNQHLKEVFNKGISNDALKDVKDTIDGRKDTGVVIDGRLQTNPKYLTNKGAYFGKPWGI